MSTATQTKPSVANEILRQLGIMIRGNLDISGKRCYSLPNGLAVLDCLISVGPNRRGNLEIILNGADLYDVRILKRNGEVVEAHKDLGVEEMISVLRTKAGL